MPRDVSTRWNSTFDMLDFALDYRAAIDKITGDRNCDLRTYELTNAEWDILGQLRTVLFVSCASAVPRIAYLDPCRF